jgi:arylsulfatase A-like enzyme
VTESAIAALERLSAGERPFFLFVHYFDPHHVYRSHPEYGFAAAGAGRLDGAESIVSLRDMRPPLNTGEVAFIRDLYDEEVRFTDSGIARLLTALTVLGRAEDTVVLLTADHGEEFLERGWLGHTRTLYDELVRVPLMMRVPGVAPRRVVNDAISLAALAPTLLELLGVPALPTSPQFPQRSLVPLLSGSPWSDSPPLMEVDFVPVYQEYAGKETRRQALVVDRWKLIRDTIAGRLELYDIELDPGETRNLARQEPEQLRALTLLLDQRLREVSAGGANPKPRSLSEQEAEALRALGYGD